MKKNKYGLWSNGIFLLRFVYKTNRAVFFAKIPQIMLNVAAPFVPIVFVSLILNEVTIGRDTGKLFVYIGLLAGVSFAIGIMKSILNCYTQNQMEITVRKIKNHLGKIVMEMPYSDVEQPKIRDFIQLAKNGVDFSTILEQLSTIIAEILTIISLFAIIINVQPIIFVFVAFVVCSQLFADKKNRILWDKWRPVYAPIMRKSQYYFRVMKNIDFGKEVRINNLQKWIFHKANNQSGVYLNVSKQHNIQIQRNSILTSAAGILQECGTYAILAYEVFFRGMPIGEFSMYIMAIKNFSNSVSSMVSSISKIMQTGLFIKDFRYCIELSEKTKGVRTRACDDCSNGNAVLELKNVSFKYPNTDRYILKNISMTLSQKESLSIVGVNGAGKTTLVKLMCRLYEPTEGEILLNGININEFAYEDYIELIGVVFQDFKLFGFSIEENIAFDETSDESKVISCMKQSGLEYKLNNLANGIKTNISKEFDSNGIEFSGGEGQRLAMARTLYKKAPVIILDEPTSALDPIAEYDMYSKFNEIIKDKLAVYISHRLSSCRFCDKIAVLDRGEIVQYGNHKELLAVDGLYARMWSMQAQYYVE